MATETEGRPGPESGTVIDADDGEDSTDDGGRSVFRAGVAVVLSLFVVVFQVGASTSNEFLGGFAGAFLLIYFGGGALWDKYIA